MNTSIAPLPIGRDATPAAGNERFAFGRNWARFLTHLTPARIAAAEASLQQMLGCSDLAGRRFLDIGSGSGLFSLAARRLGAEVRSFDYDSDSVACTRELRRRYFPGDPHWQVGQGSVLDRPFMSGLGSFDVVYSWGVLHHTGQLWQALELASDAVAPGGQLFIAIYNHVGSQTTRWARIKRTYCRLPKALRTPFALMVSAPGEVKAFGRALLAGRPARYFRSWTEDGQRMRGMTRWHDLIDWVGGYPYEAARVDEVFDACRKRGFTLERLTSGAGLGCNEFVFRRAVP
jgi:2-polyprenyl-6-hydroxyphenyl methylase/3-demethylubiquinone-9 3-methyltransferase